MEAFERELKENWKNGLKAIDDEAKELRKEKPKNSIAHRIFKWLSGCVLF